MRKILISTLGSRGDTQPYLALAVGLQQEGHRVTLTSPAAFAPWIQAYGVGVHPIRFDPQAVMASLTKNKNPFQAMRAMRGVMNTAVPQALVDCWQAAQETDLLIQTGTGSNALEVAAKRGIPVVFAYLVPMPPTRDFPAFMLPMRRSLGGRYNYLSQQWMQRILWMMLGRPTANRWRKQLGLPAWRSRAEMQQFSDQLNAPSLYGYSPSLLPKPADWDTQHHVTGYWFLDNNPDWQPPPDLVRFLQSGTAPVYIGFGSMSHKRPEWQAQVALDALAMSGQRGILATGWGGLQPGSAPPNVFFVEDVPHDWLFAQVTAVIHHGGAGTTAAGLRAGIPSIIAPFGGDQWAWADLVVKAGVGLCVGAGQRLRAKGLAAAIETALTDTTLRHRAKKLGHKIRTENGIVRAVKVIADHVL